MTQPPGPSGPHQQPGSQPFGTPASGQPMHGAGPVPPTVGAGPDTPVPMVSPPTGQRRPGHSPWVVRSLIAVIVVVLAVAAVWFFLSLGPDRSTPEATGEAFADAVNNKNIDDVKELFCADDLQNTQDIDFTGDTRSDKTFGARYIRTERNTGSTIDIIDITQHGQTATLAWPLRQSDGQWEFCGAPVRR